MKKLFSKRMTIIAVVLLVISGAFFAVTTTIAMAQSSENMNTATSSTNKKTSTFCVTEDCIKCEACLDYVDEAYYKGLLKQAIDKSGEGMVNIGTDYFDSFAKAAEACPVQALIECGK